MAVLQRVRKLAFIVLLAVVAGTSQPASADSCGNGPCSECSTDPGECYLSLNQSCEFEYPGQCSWVRPDYCPGVGFVNICNCSACG